MLNKVFLIGNLGQDPEVRHTTSGHSVVNLRVATSRRYKDRDGAWQEQTEWHTVVCFGATAERAGQYLRKGSRIFVEGRLQTRSWEDREGKRQYRTEVVSENLKFLDSRGNASGEQSGPDTARGGEGPEYSDDDIPF